MSYNYCNLEGVLKVEGREQAINGEVLIVATLHVSTDEDGLFSFPVKIFGSHYATKDLLTQDGKLTTISGKLIPYQKSLAIYVSWYNAPVVEEDKTEA
jgi:hypothetical protein